jgi:tetratricopeptide (TPR) repeat protein
MEFRNLMMDYLRKRDRGLIFLLIALVCVVYLPFLGNPFVFDDLNFFKNEAAERYASSLFHFDFRWLPYASLGWTYAIFSDVDTYFYHLGNMLLHISNVILLFYLLRQLVSASMPEYEQSKPNIWGAWLGALVFACHPIAVYAVGYVIERSILMATMFMLIMQLSYLKGMLNGSNRWMLVAVLAYFLAGFSKEHSVMAPAILAAQHLMLRGRSRIAKSTMVLTWCSFVAVGLLLVLIAKGVIGSAYEPFANIIFDQRNMVASPAMLHLLSALTQTGFFFKYLALWLLPNPAWLSVDMREHFITSLSEWQAWVGVSAFAVYGVIAFRFLLLPRWKGLLGLALLYPWLLFAVELVAVRVQEPFVLYRSYLWMPSLTLFFPWVVIRFPKYRLMLALFLVILLLPLAWNRLWIFGDNYRLWNEAVLHLSGEDVIGADRDFYNRGESLAMKGKWAEASADFEKAISLSPKFPQMHKELGIAYANQGRLHDAITQFDQAIMLEPKFAVAYYYRGLVLKNLHEDEQAMQQIEKSCELKYYLACIIVKMSKVKR